MKSNMRSNTLPSRAFEKGGMYILRSEAAYVLFVAHRVGLCGTGAHKHNDWLSFEWCLGEQPIIIDPGTGCYTGDLDKKTRYRKTGAHNTVVVNGQEQIPIAGAMFALPEVFGEVEAYDWQDSELKSQVSAKHTGYARFAGSIVHQRTVTLDKSTHQVTIDDRFVGTGRQEFDWNFHLDPTLGAVYVDHQFVISHDQKTVATVHLPDLVTDACVINGSVSQRYNMETESQILRCRFVGEHYPDMLFSFRMHPSDV